MPLLKPETADAAMAAAAALPAVSRGALKASDAAVQAITKNPQATATKVMDYAAQMNRRIQWLCGMEPAQVRQVRLKTRSALERARRLTGMGCIWRNLRIDAGSYAQSVKTNSSELVSAGVVWPSNDVASNLPQLFKAERSLIPIDAARAMVNDPLTSQAKGRRRSV